MVSMIHPLPLQPAVISSSYCFDRSDCSFILTMIVVKTMKHTISTLEVRQQLGDILNRVALRHDEYIIERKGRPLAAVVPVDKLTQLESAARSHILELMHRQKGALTNSEAM